jgi:hypothetical protein
LIYLVRAADYHWQAPLIFARQTSFGARIPVTVAPLRRRIYFDPS